MRQYALHKRLVSDVDRFMNEKKVRIDSNGKKIYDVKNLEKAMLFVMQYLSLRLVHSDEISNEEIGYIVKKVNFGSEYEIPELYNILTQELTHQEYIFRIRRIKYLKDTSDSLMLVVSPLMKELGKYMHANMIRINTKEVKLLGGNEPVGSTEKNEEHESASISSVRKQKRNPDLVLCASDPELERIRQLWDNREERNAWISANVLSRSRKHGYTTSGKYPAKIVGKAVGVDQGTVLFYLRQTVLSHSS